MRFTVGSLPLEQVKPLIESLQWDYSISLKESEYLCVSDGSTRAILFPKGSICENIVLVKQGTKMVNYLDLAEVLLKLPFTAFFFCSERRLGNKYRFITRLLGGTVFKFGKKYYYLIMAEKARMKLSEIRLRQKRKGET